MADMFSHKVTDKKWGPELQRNQLRLQATVALAPSLAVVLKRN